MAFLWPMSWFVITFEQMMRFWRNLTEFIFARSRILVCHETTHNSIRVCMLYMHKSVVVSKQVHDCIADGWFQTSAFRSALMAFHWKENTTNEIPFQITVSIQLIEIIPYSTVMWLASIYVLLPFSLLNHYSQKPVQSVLWVQHIWAIWPQYVCLYCAVMEILCKLYGELGEINANVNLDNGWLNHTSGTDSHINADIQLFHVALKPPNCRAKA